METVVLTEVEPLLATAVRARLRVLLANRHLMLLEGLTSAVGAVADIELVAATATVADAADLVRRSSPDVAVLGLDEPADVELALELRRLSEGLAVVLLTSSLGLDARTALDAGCSVLLTKGRTIRDLVGAIRSAGSGDVTFPLEFLTRQARSNDKGGAHCLTSRELEILTLLAQGVSTRQIASSLVLSCHTVRNHVNNLMAKLGVHSRLEAVVAGQRLGLLVSDQTIP